MNLLAGRNRVCGGRILGFIVLVSLLAGCRGIPTAGEKEARRDLKAVADVYHPETPKANVSNLQPGAVMADYLRFAMLNQPRVAAAYFDWAASVERITVERSLPDPKLTFESDITDVIMTVMPGLMQEFPGPGKLKAAAGVATAESKGKYFAFEAAVLQTAFDVKRTYYQLWFLTERIRINHQTLDLLSTLEQNARTQNEVGKVTLQDVYRAQIEKDKLTTEIANLEDSRAALTAQLKGALGLTQDQPNPPEPARLDSTPLELNGDELLSVAFQRNPRLKAMESDVRLAEASINLARKSRVPDFSIGLKADAKASPTLYRPEGSVSLPVWEDKIAAQIAAAQANKRAAEARLSAEQIGVTVEFAIRSYDYREATRNLELLQNQLVPKARQSLEIARSGYLAGQIDFFNLIDAERTLLNFQLEEVEARTRREITLADLSLTIAGMAPTGAPILPQAKESPRK